MMMPAGSPTGIADPKVNQNTGKEVRTLLQSQGGSEYAKPAKKMFHTTPGQNSGFEQAFKQDPKLIPDSP